jgi:hypothetical protein
MEPVPASMVEEVERTGRIHPWTIVDQGGGKWRACHDYSHLTNTLVQTSPFSLPSIWDARKVMKPGSFMPSCFIYVVFYLLYLFIFCVLGDPFLFE